MAWKGICAAISAETWLHCLGQRLVVEEPANLQGESLSPGPALHGGSQLGWFEHSWDFRTWEEKRRAERGDRFPTHWVNGARGEFNLKMKEYQFYP